MADEPHYLMKQVKSLKYSVSMCMCAVLLFFLHLSPAFADTGVRFEVGNTSKLNYYVAIPHTARRFKVIFSDFVNYKDFFSFYVYAPSGQLKTHGHTDLSDVYRYNPFVLDYTAEPGTWRIELTGLSRSKPARGTLTVKIDGVDASISESGTSASPEPVRPSSTPQASPHPTNTPVSIIEAPTSVTGAPVIDENGRVEGFIAKSDYDTFRIDFRGGLLRVASESSLDLVADLRDAKGTIVLRKGHDDGGAKNILIEKKLQPGTYYIHIRVMYHGGEGPYLLMLGDGKGPLYHENKR